MVSVFRPAVWLRWLFWAERPETAAETELRDQLSALRVEVASLKTDLEAARSALLVRELEVKLLTGVTERDRLRVLAECELLGRRSVAGERM